MVEILKANNALAKEEAIEKERLLQSEEERAKRHEEWKRCRQFKYVMAIIDEEIAKANSIQSLPTGGTVEELGQFALISIAINKRLEAIKKRLT